MGEEKGKEGETDRQTGRQTDRQRDRDWLIDWLIHCLIDWLIDRLFGRRERDWQTDRDRYRETEIDWFIHSLLDSLIDWLIVYWEGQRERETDRQTKTERVKETYSKEGGMDPKNNVFLVLASRAWRLLCRSYLSLKKCSLSDTLHAIQTNHFVWAATLFSCSFCFPSSSKCSQLVFQLWLWIIVLPHDIKARQFLQKDRSVFV